ncbi:MAG: hypothetical protein IPJ13_21935 [Saprospiraceae bacterium]|nr:hypothetical protein [Saprospiraceae bacterium]
MQQENLSLLQIISVVPLHTLTTAMEISGSENGSITLTSSEYDEYARQTKLIDINAGTTLYTTDALGQITWMNTATAGDGV